MAENDTHCYVGRRIGPYMGDDEADRWWEEHRHRFIPSAPNHLLCDTCLNYETQTWHRSE